MYKLGFKEAEELGLKLPTSIGSWKKQANSRKTSTSTSLALLKPLTVWITTNNGKFLKIWDYQTTLPVSWETCVQVKKQELSSSVKTGHGMTGSKFGKEVCQGCILSLCLFNSYAECHVKCVHGWLYSLDESQTGIKIARKSINNLRYADDITLMAKSEEKLKSLLMRMKEKSEKVDLKLNIKKKKKLTLRHLFLSIHGK